MKEQKTILSIPKSQTADSQDTFVTIGSGNGSAKKKTACNSLVIKNKAAASNSETLQYSYLSDVAPGLRFDGNVGLNSDMETPFFQLEGTQVTPAPIELPAVDPVKNVFGASIFGMIPDLQFCDDWDALVDGLYQYWNVGQPLNPDTNLAGRMVAQSEALRETEVRMQLATKFGIRPEDAEPGAQTGFVVTRLEKEIVTIGLDSTVELQTRALLAPGFEKIRAMLENIEETGSSPVIDGVVRLLTQDGTHFVREITLGDTLFQIFAYERSVYDDIKAVQTELSGPDALGFRFFTSNSFVKYASPLQLLSGDSAFKAIRENSADPGSGREESIYTVTEKNRDSLGKITSLVCMKMETGSLVELEAGPATLANRFEDPFAGGTAEIIRQSLFAKYSFSMQPNFDENPRSIFEEIWSPFQPELPSLALTKTVTVQQMYINLADLWRNRLVNKDLVETLFLIGDVIEVGESELSLEGIENVVIVCRRLIGNSGGNEAPVLLLSENAYDRNDVYLGEMEGTIVLQNGARRRTLFSGIALQTVPNEAAPGHVNLEADLVNRFPLDLLLRDDYISASIGNGLEFMLQSIRIAIVDLPEGFEITALAASAALNWIVDSTNLEENAPDSVIFHRIRTAALSLIKSLPDPQSDAIRFPAVPGLAFSAYQPAINSLLDLVGEYDKAQSNVNRLIIAENERQQQFENLEQINENIKELGNFLLDQNDALADHEADMNEILFGGIDANRLEERNKANENAADLLGKINEQATVLEKKGDALQKKVEEAQRQRLARNILQLILTGAKLLTAGGALQHVFLLDPDPDQDPAVQELGTFVKKTEAFIKVTEQLGKLVTGALYDLPIGDPIRELSKELEELPDEARENAPTALEWQLFESAYTTLILPARSLAAQAAEEFMQAVRDLSLLGQAYAATLETISSINYEIQINDWQRQVSERQEQRLRDLRGNLQQADLVPGDDYPVDLLHFGSVLQARTNNVLLGLVKLISLQNAAIGYEFVQKPDPLTRFDIISIKENLATQQQLIIRRLESFDPRPVELRESILYTVPNVPVTDLTNGIGHQATIRLDAREFINFTRVRINTLECRIENVRTNSGRLIVQLLANANPVKDRGLLREELIYEAAPVTFTVLYDIASGRVIAPGTSGGGEWIRFSPFQTWTVSIPDTLENEGLEFFNPDGSGLPLTRTNIHIDFFLEAILLPPLTADQAEPAELASDFASVPSNIRQFANRSVTNGWDAVVAVSASRITELWAQRFQLELDGIFEGQRQFPDRIDTRDNPIFQVPTGEGVYPKVEIEYILDVKLGPPKIDFVRRQDKEAECKLPIIEGVLIQTTRLFNDPDDPGMVLGEPAVTEIASTPEALVYIKAEFVMESAKGSLNNNVVIIDSSQGAFGLAGDGITLDPISNQNFSAALKAWFMDPTRELKPWELGSVLNQSNVNFLRPRMFNFSSLVPNPNDRNNEPVLLMFVQTIGRPGTLNMNLPAGTWPITKQRDAAVFVNSKLIFGHVVLFAAEKAIRGINLVKGDGDAFRVTGQEGRNIFVKELTEEIVMPNGLRRKVTRNIEVPTKNFTIKPNITGLKYEFNDTVDLEIPYVAASGFGGQFIGIGKSKMTIEAEQELNPDLDRESAVVTFPPITELSVTIQDPDNVFLLARITARREAERAEAAVQNELKDFQVDFRSVSLWAITNLLFPATKAIDLEEVYFPGDLVLTGNVVREYEAPTERVVPAFSEADNTISLPSLEAFSSNFSGNVPSNIQDIADRNVTNGWDAVVAVSASRITDLWAQRFQLELDGIFEGERQFPDRIDTRNNPIFQVPTGEGIYPKVEIEYVLDVKLGPPKIDFVRDEDKKAECKLPIIEGVLIQTTRIFNDPDDPGMVLGEPAVTEIASTPEALVYIKAEFVMESAIGSVNNNVVVIDSSQGAFGLAGDGIVLDPISDQNFSAALKAWFIDPTRELKPWELGSILNESPQRYLQPTGFNFSTLVPPADDQVNESVLLIFVQTIGDPGGPNLNLPPRTWPIMPGQDASVFIRSRLIFEQVLQAGINRVLPNSTLSANDNGSYRLSGAGQVFIENFETCFPKPFGGKDCMDEDINVPLGKFMLRPGLTGIQYEFNDDLSIRIPHLFTPPTPPGPNPRPPRPSVITTAVKLEIRGSELLVPQLDRENATITFPDITDFSANYIDNNKIFDMTSVSRSIAGQSVANKIQAQFRDLDFSFEEISLWAIANLLFPASQTIELEHVYFPGDLVLTGNVVRNHVELATLGETEG